MVYKRRLIDLLATVTCNQEQALSTAFLIGSGAPFSVMQAWADGYLASQLSVKYFSVSTAAGISYMVAGIYTYIETRG
jgi:hypothetical protein